MSPTEATGCSADWDDSGLPAWGTAKAARVVIAVESAGPWGRNPVGDSGFVAPKGAALHLVRSPGPHAHTPSHRTVLVSGGFGENPWLVVGQLDDAQVHALLASDVADPSTHRRFGLRPHDGGMLLVCTNGRRDACCAVRGRPVVLAAYDAAPEAVWEVSHIGGHRFAPTAIHLPSGQTFGRLDEADGAALARASLTDVLPDGLFTRAKHRGRIDLASAECVAETWWREQHPRLPLSPPVRVGAAVSTETGRSVELPDGRRLLVTTQPGPQLRDSCAKLPKLSMSYRAVERVVMNSKPHTRT